MPFTNYGVLIGTKTEYKRDDLNDGKYFHGNIKVWSNNREHRCAIDVDSKFTQIQWRIIELSESDLELIANRTDSWHHLVSNETSGAIDYIRWKAMWVTYTINIPVLIRNWIIRVPPWLAIPKPKRFDDFSNKIRYNSPFTYKIIKRNQSSFWLFGNNIDAIEQLESVLVQGDKVYVFGEFFDTGYGVHNIHQNQGDPIGGGHDTDNWIWQDGATIVQRPDGSFVGFFNKFMTQSFQTNNQGKPI